MNQKDFRDLYIQEQPMYEAWADFVCSKIESSIREFCSSEKEYLEWVKIPPMKRVKSAESLVSKVFVRHYEYYKDRDAYNEIQDKAGVRFVVLLTSQLDKISQRIFEIESWDAETSREFDDWKDKDPRLFDYQSVHIIVTNKCDFEYQGSLIKAGTTCEVQVRTLMQHAYAELAHDTIYKGSVKAEPKVIRSFAKGMALMETTDGLLCEAKQTLDQVSNFIDSWKSTLREEHERYLADSEVVFDDATNDYMIDYLSELLRNHTPSDFSAYLAEYTYVPGKLRHRIDLGIFPEFRESYMLLIYFLAKKDSRRFARKWPYDRRIIEGVYSDVAARFPLPTT